MSLTIRLSCDYRIGNTRCRETVDVPIRSEFDDGPGLGVDLIIDPNDRTFSIDTAWLGWPDGWTFVIADEALRVKFSRATTGPARALCPAHAAEDASRS